MGVRHRTHGTSPACHTQVDELAVSDTHRIFVAWTRYGTQLGSPGAGGTAGPGDSSSSSSGSSKQQHSQWLGAGGAPVRQGSPAGPAAAAGGGGSAPLPPSYHSGLIRGVDLITFNHDRSRILEVRRGARRVRSRGGERAIGLSGACGGGSGWGPRRTSCAHSAAYGGCGSSTWVVTARGWAGNILTAHMP